MNKIFLIFLIFIINCFLSLNAFSIENALTREIETYSENGYFGLKEKNSNKIITKAEYKKLIYFSDESWIIQKKNKYGIIDSEGNYLIKPKYRHADRLYGGFVKLGNSSDYGLYDKEGKTILEPIYSSIDQLFNGLFLTCKNFKYGVADKNGKILLQNEFEDIYMPKANVMRIKSDGEWFELEEITSNNIELPDNAIKLNINDKTIKITHLVSTTGLISGYSVVTLTDYLIKIISSISPAYEQTIDELMLSQGAETVSIFVKFGWLPKFPFVYGKNYYLNLKNPYNGPLSDIKSELKRKF